MALMPAPAMPTKWTGRVSVSCGIGHLRERESRMKKLSDSIEISFA